MKSQENNYDAIKNHFYGTLGFIQLLDMRITELSEGYCKGEMPLRPEILNPLGSVHGGCTFALADTIHYLAPARNTEKLVAEAKEIKYGSTIAVYEVNVYKADGTMVATSIQSYFVFSDKNKKDKS